MVQRGNGQGDLNEGDNREGTDAFVNYGQEDGQEQSHQHQVQFHGEPRDLLTRNNIACVNLTASKRFPLHVFCRYVTRGGRKTSGKTSGKAPTKALTARPASSTTPESSNVYSILPRSYRFISSYIKSIFETDKYSRSVRSRCSRSGGRVPGVSGSRYTKCQTINFPWLSRRMSVAAHEKPSISWYKITRAAQRQAKQFIFVSSTSGRSGSGGSSSLFRRGRRQISCKNLGRKGGLSISDVDVAGGTVLDEGVREGTSADHRNQEDQDEADHRNLLMVPTPRSERSQKRVDSFRKKRRLGRSNFSPVALGAGGSRNNLLLNFNTNTKKCAIFS